MTTNDPQTIEQAQALLGDLPATDLPVALFPVRLETRFVEQNQAHALCVRVFPDDLHVETHEPELTEDEERWGRHLWAQAWRTGGDAPAEQALRDELARRFGAGRAAWIARVLAPLNPEDRPSKPIPEPEPLPVAPVYPDVPRRDEAWTRPPRTHAMPDRWVVLGYRDDQRVLTAVGRPIPDSLAAGPDPRAPGPAVLADSRLAGYVAGLVQAHDVVCIPNLPDTPASVQNVAYVKEAMGSSGVVWESLLLDAEGSTRAAYFWNPEHIRLEKTGPPGEAIFIDEATGEPCRIEEMDAAVITGLEDAVLLVDDGMRWMVDFDRAVQDGMGLRIPISGAEAQAGYDRLVVLGLKAQGDGEATATEIEALLEAQRYTDSLAFVPQGTPSNTTEEASSGYAGSEPDQWTAFASNQNGEAPTPESNRLVTAEALGLDPAMFDRIPYAGDAEQANARAVNTALWPATWGYFLRHVVGGALTDDAIEQTRRHFINYVRARGPVPVLRVGQQPYGILPVTAFDRYVPRVGDAFGPRGLDVLRALRTRWRRALARVPHVQSFANQEDIEQALADILGLQATADHVQGRIALDGSLYGLQEIEGLHATPSQALLQRSGLAMGLLRELGVTDTVPGASMVFSELAFRLADGLVASGALPPGGPVDPDYITEIRKATFAALRDEQLGAVREHTDALYLLLRHAMLLAYAEAGYRIQVAEGLLPPGTFTDPGLVDILSMPDASGDGSDAEAALEEGSAGGPPEHTPTPLRLLDATVPGLGSGPLRDRIHRLTAASHPEAAILDEMRKSLDHLATVPAARLDALLRETLDLASHRLDAWMTSLATARLFRLRRKKPTGLLVGGYGWVENLRMAGSRTPVSPEPPGEEAFGADPLYDVANNGGYVAAPSLTHASTAAILRSGYLAYKDGSPTAPFAIDLTSERVRLAEWLLDGVRQGQPLRALLGYRFERALRENGLARYIRPFRIVAPFGEIYETMAEKAVLDEQMEALIAQQTTEMALAQSALNALQNQINNLTAQINSKTSQRSTLQSQVNNLNKQIAAKQTQLNNFQAEVDFWQAEVNRLSKNRPPTDEQLMEAKANLAGAKFQRDRAKSERDALVSQRNTKQSQINSLTSQINTLTSQRSAKLVQRTQKQQEIATLAAQHTAARNALQEQINEVQGRIDELEAAYRAKYTATTSLQAMENIEIQHVVDGMALVRKWQAGAIPFGQKGLPEAGTPDADALGVRLDALGAAVDAVSDLVTAESVYQLARGNQLRAGATLDAVARGETPPPEPEFVRTPRSMSAHTHRVAVLLSATPEATAAWKTDSFQRRANAEPALNAWLARLLPDPARVRIEATYRDPQTNEPLATRSARLDTFFLSPLDAVYLGGAMGPGSALELLMAYRLLRFPPFGVPLNARVSFGYEREADWAAEDVSFGTFLEVARAARDLMTSARPLDARDLALPETFAPTNLDHAGVKHRADEAANDFKNARTNLHSQIEQHEAAGLALDPLRVGIFRLFWLGIPEAVPQYAKGDEPEARRILLDQARSVLVEADRRVAALDAAEAAIDRGAMTPEARVEHDVKRLQIVFGADFRVLPQFQPAEPEALAATFSDSLLLQGQDPLAAVDWFQQIMHVRDGAARLHTSLTYAEALSADAEMTFTVGQLPYTADDRWVALPHDPGRPADAPRVSLVVHSPDGFQSTAPAAGLMIDEWVEAVPAPHETAGVAFHFDAPAVQAPQSILLAVPPDERPQWDLETLEAIVQETLELAKLRAVDAAALAEDPEHGHFLPALYLAFNPAGDTVSTDLGRVAAP